MGRIYSGDSEVDRHPLISFSSCHTTIIYILSCPTFGLNRTGRDFVDVLNWVDLHDQVVSDHFTLVLRSTIQNHSFSCIPFRCHKRWGGVVKLGSLSSHSIVSPQLPASGASLSFLIGILQVLFQISSSTICGQMDLKYLSIERLEI